MASQLHELSERPPRYITKEEAALINPENIDALQITEHPSGLARRKESYHSPVNY
jgi:hypothetical protein